MEASKGNGNHLGIHAGLGGGLSIYLDALRVIAATLVFIAHSVEYHLYDGWVPLSEFSHTAVIVFFVLSGIVISATAARPQETGLNFAVARAARIYSVALPAIILCVLLGWIYAIIHDDIFDEYWLQNGPNPSKLIIAATFLLQSWNDNYLPWNAPYWSLCYEAWYYIIFGIIFYARKPRRAPLAIIAAAIAGPAILALLPIWWLGVEFMRRPNLSFGWKPISYVVFFLSISGIYFITTSKIDIYFQHIFHDNIPLFWKLHNSQRIMTDYVIGILLVANITAFRDVQDHIGSFLTRMAKPIRFVSGYTFSIYLFHFPIIMFCARQFPNTENSVRHYIFFVVMILLTTIILGEVTEKRKGIYRKAINNALRYLLRSYRLLVAAGR